MKRLIALLAVFVLVAAACGDDEPEPAADEEAPGETSAEPAEAAAPSEMMLDELNVAYFLEWPTA
ncbi:MAG: galactose ABC transporter substrate-binding protein, partial [Acidimicrobiaceae bacterium]|nr:galactose ABC transporter substrate-binding protein [Acidimicrobiaceae bacterium]